MARSPTARAATSSLVAGGIGLAPLRPALLERARATRGLRPGDRPLRRPHARGAALRRRARALARSRSTWRSRSPSTARRRRAGAGRSGWSPQLIPRAGFDPERTLALVCGPEMMMRLRRGRAARRGVPAERIRLSMERNMQLRHRACAGTASCASCFICVDGPVLAAATGSSRLLDGAGAVMAAARDRRPKLAVWKFASLRRLPADAARLRGRAAGPRRRDRDRLLPRGDAGRLSTGPTTCRWSRGRSRRPHDAERIQEVRRHVPARW